MVKSAACTYDGGMTSARPIPDTASDAAPRMPSRGMTGQARTPEDLGLFLGGGACATACRAAGDRLREMPRPSGLLRTFSTSKVHTRF
jgi:hypothetical protein